MIAVVLAHEISWPWLVPAAVVLIFVPLAIGSGWVSQYPSRCGREAFIGAVTTAGLPFALIRVDVAWVRALLAMTAADLLGRSIQASASHLQPQLRTRQSLSSVLKNSGFLRPTQRAPAHGP